ncbi:hypothetical protein ACOI9X_14435 [Pseudomonas sp. P2757]|uniref:hypothetical protein n=1 Tax=unclassified Pseudomonas TaxID=196821 RepID=UPI003B5A6408
MNKYISGKVLFSNTPYVVSKSFKTSTSLYKLVNSAEYELVKTNSQNSLVHDWWEFEFLIEQAPGEASQHQYQIVAEVFIEQGELLASAKTIIKVDFNYGSRHHEDLYLEPVLII